MNLQFKIEKLEELRLKRGWSEFKLARKLDLDYAYMYRIFRGKRKGGLKLVAGIIKICKEEKLDFYDFVKLDRGIED